MTIEAYFDMRNLTTLKDEPGGCPVAGCTASLGTASSQWGELPYCPVHRIRIHVGSRTFVYYNGTDRISKRDAALRNILFERQYFKEHILGNAAKAETHRICHETSEDALTWNVFSKLAGSGLLAMLLSKLVHLDVKNEPELYMWGLNVRLDHAAVPQLFDPLKNARHIFESGISRFLTEPDVMLYVPNQLLVLVEAKFTSGNTIASASPAYDSSGDKPKSRDGIVGRYTPAALPQGELLAPSSSGPFYSQLYRNLVFAIHMANELGVRWDLVNLVSEEQFNRRQHNVEFQDPSRFIQELLPEKSRDQFHFYSWERLYADHVAKTTGLNDLAEYMYNKSANGVKALAI